ncbi:unnamed protein product [Caenorhabditis sp. 36 PRJEB53466]|nr:unnamed protein product [Caenorhabditis sp. 36 PRJEB53466]
MSKSIIGIVVGQVDPQKYYVWSNETYVGRDGMILVPFGVRVDLGDWVVVSFGPIQAATFFPSQKSEHTPRFESSDFRVIRAIYETTPIGKTVQIKLNQCLTAGQTVIEHHFFKKIYNDTVLVGDGDWNLTIRRVEPRVGYGRESVWILDRVASIPERPKTGKDVIGIVVGTKNASENYVWCKETRPGFDGTIVVPDSGPLPSGTWVRMSFTQQEVDVYFENEQEIRFKSWNYSILTALHPTEPYKQTIKIKLKCFIDGNEQIKDIIHPFVGLVKNDKQIENSGKYEIRITRVKPSLARDSHITSVWVVSELKLVRDEPSVLTLEEPIQILPSLPEQDVRPSPETSHRPVELPRHAGQIKKAIIVNIKRVKDRDQVFVWLLDDHKDGLLRLDVDAATLGLTEGNVFTAEFTDASEGKVESRGPITREYDYYETRGKGNGNGVEFKIFAETLVESDPNNEPMNSSYPSIYHHHFGYVVDNFRRLKNHEHIKYHMWIKKARVGDVFRWVIVEQVGHGQ